MLSTNVKDYLKVYDNFLTKEECSNLVEELKSTNWSMHTFYNNVSNQSISHDKELDVSYHSSELAKKTQDKIWHIINDYISIQINSEWFSSWAGYSQIRFNKYDVNTEMKLHCDHIHSMFDGQRKGIPVLSILGALNDDYEGGELVFWESDVIELKAGSIMVFPSNFLYPHKVKEVTKGTRYSYVSWVW